MIGLLYTLPLLEGLSGALVGMLLFYLLASLLVRRWLRIDHYELALSMAVAFLVAILCEVYLGKLYFQIAGKPLWQYRVWPIHDGYTSAVNFLVWPVYGCYFYLLHQVLQARRIRIHPHWLKGIAAGFDGPLLEFLANGFFLLCYGTFYFYYLPGDLHHFTSLQVVPLYMVMGVVLALVLEYFRTRPPRWRYPVAFYLAGLGFVLTG